MSVRLVFAVLLTVVVSAAPIVHAQQQGVGGGFAAAGQPIDQIDCTNARQIVERMRRDLPGQEEALRRTRAQLDTARNDSRQAGQAANQVVTDAIRSELTDIARDYVQSLDVIKDAADRLKRATGAPAEVDRLLELVDSLEGPAGLIASADNASAGADIIRQRNKSLVDSITKLNEFFVSSGTADELFDELVGRLALTNPPAALLARGSRVMLDVVVLSEDSFDRAVEAQQAAHTANLLQDQINRIKDRVDLLTSRCLTPQTNNNRTNTNGNSQPPAPKSGIGAGKIATLAVAAGSAIGGYMYYQKTMAENEAFLQEFGNFTTPTPTPVQNTTPTTPAPPTGVRAFDGTYDFEFVRTMPGGAQETVRLSRYLSINNGRLTTSENSINGTVDANGLVNAVGLCPINSEPADWRGTMTRNGAGSGDYTCRFGGIRRTWTASNRR